MKRYEESVHKQAHQIVGRAAELHKLDECLQTTLDSQRQLVFVTGEPGIGKTTLVDTFLASLSTQTDLCIGHGQCIEQYGTGEAYLPILEALTRLGQTAEGEQLREVLRQQAPTWLSQLPSLLTAAEREPIQRQIQGTTQERMLRELAEALTVFSSAHGLVLVLEDLHWSDTSTVELLAYLARRREPARLLIIGTYRPVELSARDNPLKGVVQELQARQQCQELPLSLLSAATVDEYLIGQLTQTASLPALTDSALRLEPTAVATLIHQRTEGNPLFMVTTIDYLSQQGLIREEAGRWIFKADVTLIEESVPDSLRQLIEKQLDSLPSDAQHVLEVASVVGVEFSAASVVAGSGLADEVIEASCEALARKQQFIRGHGLDEWPDGTLGSRYSFVHVVYHHVLYNGIPRARRVRLHRQIGSHKEAAYGRQARTIAAELAMHFERGRAIPKAVLYLEQAGRAAVQRHAYQAALRYCQHGLTLLETLPDSSQRTQQELHLQLALIHPVLALRGFTDPRV